MKNISFSPPDITQEEIEAVENVMRSGWLTTGFKTKEFEKKIAEYCCTKEAICMNSATACLEMAIRLLGIGYGDEVITTPYTYSASCAVILHTGATPVLVDTGENSFEMDYDKIYNSINEKTKAIIPVDFGGVLCNYDKIFEILNFKKKIFNGKNDIQKEIGRVCVLSDSAHSFGAKRNGKVSGSIADFTAFSFHAVKNLTTVEGGALVWNINCEDIYKKLSLLSLHGQTKDALSKMDPKNWEYDIVFPGYKNNMTDIFSAIGIVQLKRFDFFLKKRMKLVKIYNNLLKDQNIKIYQDNSILEESSMHLYVIRLMGKDQDFRNNLIKRMSEKGIATNVHYKPLPLFTFYKNYGFNMNDFPNAFNMYKNEITLPLNTLMSEEDVFYVCENFKKELN
ncbi:MAG: DegT/DnrJ/EryC1/StrS family aminotransferase [Firmicutes bacterium]|nr:DegT/DnrJ/EryC1/StrS family aminotransferase [Bacillota bacterium]